MPKLLTENGMCSRQSVLLSLVFVLGCALAACSRDENSTSAADEGAETQAGVMRVEDSETTGPVPQDLPFETRHEFDCAGAGPATLRFVGSETIELSVGGETHVLLQERSASGARYTTEGILFWNKGDEAMLEIGGERFSCTRT